MPTIIVLNDGETYTDADGCTLIDVSDEFAADPDELESRLDVLMLSDAGSVPGLRIRQIFDSEGNRREDSPFNP